MGLEGVEIIMSTETEFGIEISNAEAEALRVIEDLHLLVISKLGSAAPDPTEVWDRIRDIIVMETGTPREQIKPGNDWLEIGVR
jgi:hypothetical protein